VQCQYSKYVKHTIIVRFHLILTEFYFNSQHAILGAFSLDDVENRKHNDVPCILPFDSFLATPLLPCSDIDRPVQKFTGSDSLGPAKDDLTMALHAYTHFTVVFTRRSVIITDLQGEQCIIQASCREPDD
jgi:hypothetical protein